MPGDDRGLNQNIIDYSQVFSDILILINSVIANYICIDWDFFNTDLSRLNIQTKTLNTFAGGRD